MSVAIKFVIVTKQGEYEEYSESFHDHAIAGAWLRKLGLKYCHSGTWAAKAKKDHTLHFQLRYNDGKVMKEYRRIKGVYAQIILLRRHEEVSLSIEKKD